MSSGVELVVIVFVMVVCSLFSVLVVFGRVID